MPTFVVAAVRPVIQTAKSTGCGIGICGQAPSDYPEFAEMLVMAGIDGISLNPDAALSTTLSNRDAEQRLGGA